MAIDAGGNKINKIYSTHSRDIFLPNGRHGEFDGYWAVPTFNAPILRDGKLIIHYEGRPDPHTAAGFSHVPPAMSGAIGLSTLREDGFVSLDATGTTGIVLTRRLQIPAGARGLNINACVFNTRPGYIPMEIGVEILEPDSLKLVESFSYQGKPSENQTWLTLDATKSWPEVIQIRFYLQNARFYSFQVRI